MEFVIDPSRVRTLLVPIGKWKREDFLRQVSDFRLKSEIRLVDITPLPDCIFNPQIFPHGRILYSFIEEAIDNTSKMFLHDFEPYRKVFMVLGLCNDGTIVEDVCLGILKEKFNGAISFGVIYTCEPKQKLAQSSFNLTDESLETVMCDITRNFLEALSTYYSSYKHVTLRSPGVVRGSSVLKTVLTGNQGRTGANVKRILSQSKDSPPGAVATEVQGTPEISKRYSALNSLSLTPSTSDKAAQRSKARQLKLLANFQLLAGHYTLSLSNFSEAVKLLHKLHDYIWLANALEGISTCIKLLSYLQVSFQIPHYIHTLCPVSQPTEIPTLSNSSRRSSTTSLSSPRNSVTLSTTGAALNSNSINIPRLIKSIGDKILHYYNYSLSHSVEYVPQIVYCETILRTLNFMSLCYKGGGLTQNVLKEIVFENNKLNICDDPDKYAEEYFTKNEIFNYSNKIFEVQLKSMEILDQIQVYSALARVYGNLGMMRKRAFVLRILFVSMLSQSSQLPKCHISSRFDLLIDELLHEYAIEKLRPEISTHGQSTKGWVTLQKNVLFLILRIYSADNNYQKSLYISELLLKRFSDTLTKREQTDILENEILPYKNEGLIEYMDPFMLRDISFENKHPLEMPLKKQLTTESLTCTKPQETNEIFNPFSLHEKDLKGKETGIETTSCNGYVSEVIRMKVTLQNPFKFDIKITNIKFETDHCDSLQFLDKKFLAIVVPANSIVTHYYDVILSKATTIPLKIEGLQISVFDLPLKFFRIYKENTRASVQPYIPSSVFLKILEPLPSLKIICCDLLNNKVVTLDGTKTTFKIHLKNMSLFKRIDYFDISWETDAQSEFEGTTWAKMVPDDRYEADLRFDYLKNRILKFSPIPTALDVNDSFTLEIELDLTHTSANLNLITITIHYGCRSNDGDQYAFVKSLSLPVKVYNKRVLEVSNITFIPITENFETESDIPWIKFLQHSSRPISDYVLMLLDIHNSYLEQVNFKLEFKNYKAEKNSLAADETRRYVIPVPKIILDTHDVHLKLKPVPRLDKSKQFVSSGLSPSQECAMRERFWCREYILNNLICHWQTEKQNFIGNLYFRQYIENFDTNMVNLLYPASNPFDISLSASKTTVKPGESIQLKFTIHTSNHHALVPVRFHLQDFFTGKSALQESNKDILFQGQISTRIKPGSSASINILPIKSGRYQLNLEIFGMLQLRQPLIIHVS